MWSKTYLINLIYMYKSKNKKSNTLNKLFIKWSYFWILNVKSEGYWYHLLNFQNIKYVLYDMDIWKSAIWKNTCCFEQRIFVQSANILLFDDSLVVGDSFYALKHTYTHTHTYIYTHIYMLILDLGQLTLWISANQKKRYL